MHVPKKTLGPAGHTIWVLAICLRGGTVLPLWYSLLIPYHCRLRTGYHCHVPVLPFGSSNEIALNGAGHSHPEQYGEGCSVIVSVSGTQI